MGCVYDTDFNSEKEYQQYVEVSKNETSKDFSTVHGNSWYFSGFHEEDGSFYLNQHESPVFGKVKLSFGPLSTTLNDLIDDGYRLSIEGFKHQRKVKLKLINLKKNDGYVLYAAPLFEFLKHSDLGMFVNETKNYLLRRIQPENVRGKYVESPFEILKRQYPYKKPDLMVGNMTVDEYVKMQLKSKG